MFVVKRPFKNLGNVYTAGSVISEPASIKRFKGKVAEGKIIEVTEHNYDETAKYFKSKYGVDIPPIAEKEAAEKEATEKEAAEKEASKVKAEAVKAKAVVK